MLNLGRDIHSKTDFNRRTAELLAQLHQTRRPNVLTINGRAEGLVQDAKAYRQLLDAAGQREAYQQELTGVRNREVGHGRRAGN